MLLKTKKIKQAHYIWPIEMWLYSCNTARITELIQVLHSRTTNAVSHTNVHLCTSRCRIFSGFDRLGCKGWAQVQTEGVVGLFNKVNAFFWANYRNLKSERLLLFCSECVWNHIHLLFSTSTINMLGQQKMPDAVWCQQADQFSSVMVVDTNIK